MIFLLPYIWTTVNPFETIMQCIRAGYTSVMIDSSKLPYQENIAAVKRVVEIAKLVDVAVEGEIGRIGELRMI